MYYIIFCRGKFGDSSSNQKMNRQYKKKRQKDKQWSTKHYAEKKTKVIRTQTPLHEHVVPVALVKPVALLLVRIGRKSIITIQNDVQSA